jgi:type II secretory ATPase GspE/PulE/Tfp pilus assembly ATPase PilB-like protein
MEEGQFLANLALLGVSADESVNSAKVLRSVGCQQCQNLGYRGRVGIFEIMPMSDGIHSLVIKNAAAPDIRRVAIEEGMRSLQLSGWEQIKRGLTTFDEVIRYSDGFGTNNGDDHSDEIPTVQQAV